jgi:hypothetical protein
VVVTARGWAAAIAAQATATAAAAAAAAAQGTATAAAAAAAAAQDAATAAAAAAAAGWHLVDEIEVLVVATQTVVFPGLTGSPLKYKITGHINPLLLGNLLARPNGGTTNLAFQGTVTRNDGTVIADSGNTLKFALTGDAGAGSSCQIDAEMEAPTGQGFRVGRSLTTSEMVSIGFFDFNMYSWIWRDSTTPITGWTLFHAGGAGIGVGSKFQLWELTS